jgi:hypothetical protein
MLAEASLDVAWPLIEYFTTMVRESGSSEERKAFEYIRRQLEGLGIPFHFYEPELYLSVPKWARVEFNGRSFHAKAQAFSAGTPPRGLTGELLYIPADSADELFSDPESGAAKDYDVAGKIVLTEGLANPECCWDFERRGAIAQVYINPGRAAHWGIATTIWGMPDLDSMARVPNTPVLAIGRPDGDALVAAAKTGRSKVTLQVQMDQGWKRVPLIVADIPGSEEPDRFVLAHGHLDSWGLGGGDNAVGNAALLELARVFWTQRDGLRRSIRLAWWPGHSTGRYAGSTWYADQFAIDLADNCIAQVNIDSPGCRDATAYTGISWMSETELFCQDAIRAVTGLPSDGERAHRAGDYSFNNIGISSFFMLLSTMPPELAKEKGLYGVGGCGGNIEWHTEDDDISVADRDNLLRDIKVYISTLSRAANADVYPFDFRPLADEFARTLDSYQEAAGGRFDFSLAVAEVRKLGGDLVRLYDAAARAAQAGDAAACGRINDAILRLARILVPINFGREGRFRHDPAAPIPPLPDLAPARKLAGLSPETDLAHFTVASLVRGQNRLVDALHQAQREVALALGSL